MKKNKVLSRDEWLKILEDNVRKEQDTFLAASIYFDRTKAIEDPDVIPATRGADGLDESDWICWRAVFAGNALAGATRRYRRSLEALEQARADV